MNPQSTFLDFIRQQGDKILSQTAEHIGLTFISLLIAVVIGVPLGIFVARKKRWAGLVLGTAGILQTIPSIALLGIMIPLLGIGPVSAIVALFLYALLPIIRNTYTGITGVDPVVIEAARGMGMSSRQILTKVELPLAMPVLLAGIRTATVINVGVATLAAYIAAGGLGEFIFGGIALNNSHMMLAGAIPAAGLAILFDFLLSRIQKWSLRKSHAAIWLLPVIILLLSSFYLLPAVYGSRLLAGFTPEFMGRSDGYLGLREKYSWNLRTVVISDAVMYNAAREKKLDIISGYSTDGRIKAYDLQVLHDDQGIFPPYYAAPIVRREVLQQYPELETALNSLSGLINDSIMTALNYQADFLKQDPEQIARGFLKQKQLWQPPRNGKRGTIRLGSKIFAEQYILINMYRMLIEGSTDLKVVTKTGLGGTKICFDALTNGQIDCYPEYTGTGLLVMLQPEAAVVARVSANKDSVYQYVQQEFLRRYGVGWLKPIGFNNAYALMMRRQQAAALSIRSISDLVHFANKQR
ncbi:MAG: ABC transporter permease/substrate-binding protein [Williamsia sp.]|nr:ABC transporter permease/substrate-binding protein [Williamsia sp.]